MSKNETSNILLTRIIAFLAGALVVVIVMSVAVVNPAKALSKDLQTKLDASIYEPGVLLGDAKALAQSKDYLKAKESLDLLFSKHPGSAQAAEGKLLYDSVTASEKKGEDKWQAAQAGIKQRWSAETMAKLRADFEKGLADTVSQEWDKSKDQIRSDWEKS